MIVKRFYDARLAQASYLIGCGRTGSAIVIDPSRDIGQYLDMAADEGVAVTHVTETHIHADFVSGARELAARTGAALFLSDEGDADWKYAFARADGAVLLKDGAEIRVGNVVLRAVHTPGHTPEHLSFLVTDTAAANEPIAIVTGDFVFVGDVGRPDLLEKAARVEGTMEQAARTLYASLQRFASYPDWLQIWPGHGAGSACGKGLSAVPHSTVGYERRFNWAFEASNEEEFVRMVLAGQPEPPTYFAEMKRINKDGPPLLGAFRRPERLGLTNIVTLLGTGALVIDSRPANEYAARHIPGTINIPLNRSFNTWAGWLVPFDRDFYLVIDEGDPAHVDEAARDLAMIGLDRVAGYFGSSVIDEWAAAGNALGSIRQITTEMLAERMVAGDVSVLDVRGSVEWDVGHLPGARNIPVGHLTAFLGDIPREVPLVVHCQSGARSAIAASVLQARGFTNVLNLGGGFAAWQERQLPVERGIRDAALPVGVHS